MGGFLARPDKSPKITDRGPSCSTDLPWLMWLAQIFMIRLFSVRSHPPMALPARDHGRGQLGDNFHHYRQTGAVAGGFGILSAIVGPAKTWRVIGKWAAAPIITDRGAGWCSGSPSIIMIPQQVYSSALRGYDVIRCPPRHADFPGHWILPYDAFSDDQDDSHSQSSGSDSDQGATGMETPPKRKRRSL